MLPPWTPDLPALDLLLSVAELGSVGQAAAAHQISQPSASTRLARLERQLGVRVLIRTSRGSTLTPAGEAVVAWANATVDAAHLLTDGVLTLRNSGHTKLRVAASLTIAEYLMPSWLLRLRTATPDLDIAVSVVNSEEVCERVRTGQADLGFVEMPTVPPGLHSHHIGEDGLALVVAPTSPLAGHAAEPLTPQDLLGLRLLLREPGSGTRDTFLNALAEALGTTDFQLPQATELGSTTTIVSTARAGGGVAVVSARAVAAYLASGQLVELRTPALTLTRPLHAIWRGRHATAPARELIHVAGALPT